MISIKHATEGQANVTISPTFTSSVSLSFLTPTKKIPSLISYCLEHSEEISRAIYLLAREIKSEVAHVGPSAPISSPESEKQSEM